MGFRIRCPYCHYTLSSGKGVPFKHIGNPIKRCRMCKKYYVDSNVYEWGAIRPIYKFWFYFVANNRGLLFFLLLLFARAFYASDHLTVAIILSILLVIWQVVVFLPR